MTDAEKDAELQLILEASHRALIEDIVEQWLVEAERPPAEWVAGHILSLIDPHSRAPAAQREHVRRTAVETLEAMARDAGPGFVPPEYSTLFERAQR